MLIQSVERRAPGGAQQDPARARTQRGKVYDDPETGTLACGANPVMLLRVK